MSTEWTIDDLWEMSHNGIAICECSVCGAEINGEPDADTLYCDNCEKVVPVYNPINF